MMNMVSGGQTFYGFDIGIIMLDTKFPRIIGDIGNAHTFSFPVLYDKVIGWKPEKVVLDLKKQDIEPFIKSAKRLEDAGCRIITTSCGFLSMFQEELSNSVNVSVFTSALLMAPMIKRTIASCKKVCILTANKKTLTEVHLKGAGIDKDNYVIYGLEKEKNFTNFTVQNWEKVDIDECRKELKQVTLNALEENSNIGAILLECTNMPPYAKEIQEIAKLPVYDIISLLYLARESINKVDYSGRYNSF